MSNSGAQRHSLPNGKLIVQISSLLRALAVCTITSSTLWGCSPVERNFESPEEPARVDVDQEETGVGENAEQFSSANVNEETNSLRTDTSSVAVSNDTDEPQSGSFGASCEETSQCTAGTCVDGVCCNSPCGELCASCNQPGSLGTCVAAAKDEACPALDCAGTSTECRQLDRSQVSLNCESFGKCRTAADCTEILVAAGSPCAAATGTCDGSGACIVPDKAALGESCSVGDDCAEGNCVRDSQGALLCCDSACDGVCQACSDEGRCDATPTTDTTCEVVQCPSDNVCRDYPEQLTEDLCRGFDQCRTEQDCPFTTLRPDAQCACDVTGDCELTAATSCEQGAQCASGECSETSNGSLICCASNCGSGLFCSTDGQQCVQCEGSEIRCEGDLEVTCNNGSKQTLDCPNGCTPSVGCNLLPPVGFLCQAGQCALSGTCQQDIQNALRCCSRNCGAEGKLCSENGSCVCPEGLVGTGDTCLLQPGDPCEQDNQCQSENACVDGVCCQQACDGFCEQCQPGTGLCEAVSAGQQDDSCNNTHECTGQRNACRARLGQPCANGGDCVSGVCEATAGGGPNVCCSQACGGNSPSCRASGNGCVQCESGTQCGNGCNNQGFCNALKSQGEQCGNNNECSGTGVCLLNQDNRTVCCERNCAATGEVCGSQGQCLTLRSDNGDSCSNDNQCQSFNCEQAENGRVCCSLNCSANQICRSVGGGQQQCVQCVSDNDPDCGNGCNEQTGQCNALLPNGSNCTNNNECAGSCTTFFVDGDGDGFAAVTAQTVRRCTSGGTTLPGFTNRAPLNPASTDCCDTDANARPSRSPNSREEDPNRCGNYDYNCNGRIEVTHQLSADLGLRSCLDVENAGLPCGTPLWLTATPACGSSQVVLRCRLNSGKCDVTGVGLLPTEVNACR